MLKNKTPSYLEIREYLDTVPVIDTHEHFAGVTEPIEDVLGFVAGNYYFQSDMISSAFGFENDVQFTLMDRKLSFDERYEVFERYYKRTDKTAFARSMLAGLQACWGVQDLSKQSLLELGEKLKGRNQTFYEQCMDHYGIRAAVVDLISPEQFLNVMERRDPRYSKYSRFAMPLPDFHHISSYSHLNRLQSWMGKKFRCLDDYMEGFEQMLIKSVNFGVVCLKDQSAYRRSLHYENATKSEAEAIFNRIVSHPRDTYSSAEVKPLDDWLFNTFLSLAGKYRLPVQLHTGHMAGNYNDIRKTNAVHLIPTLELHQDVKFDLFHGNWPYMDEYLFIGKNFPNAYLDLCWAHIIDPVYCVELMKRALVAVPHSKVMVYGGDTFHIEFAIGYLIMARDNTACALSEMVDSGWIGMNEAKQLAADWFYNNPNEFFNLGFDGWSVH